jgi:hypothetical protein
MSLRSAAAKRRAQAGSLDYSLLAPGELKYLETA